MRMTGVLPYPVIRGPTRAAPPRMIRETCEMAYLRCRTSCDKAPSATHLDRSGAMGQSSTHTTRCQEDGRQEDLRIVQRPLSVPASKCTDTWGRGWTPGVLGT